MQLTYRGVSYQHQTKTLAPKKTKIVAKFRGATYQLSQSIEPATDSPYPLKYRGISYQKSSQISTAPAPRPRLSIPLIASSGLLKKTGERI